MAFTPWFFAHTATKFAAAAGIVCVGFSTTVTAANASVLVEPAILRGETEVASPSQPTPAAGRRVAQQNIVEVAGNNADFSTLTTALIAADVSSVLVDDGPFTVFAPTDAAFASLPPGTLDTLLMPENSDLLVKLLYNHVAYGDVSSDQLSVGPLDTFEGNVAVNITPNGVTVDGASVIQADVMATNGVIHAVDTVLLPAGFSDELQARINGGGATAAESTSESTAGTSRVTTLQQSTLDRSVPPTQPAPVTEAPTEDVEENAPAATNEPVRGLW